MNSGSPPGPPAGRAPSVRCMFPQHWGRVRTSALSTPGSNAVPPRCDVEQVTPSRLRSSPLKLEEAVEAGVASRRSTWAPHQPGIEACCFVCWSDGHRQLLSSSLPSSLKWKCLHRFHRGFLWQLNGLMKNFYYDSFCKGWDELILNLRAVPGTQKTLKDGGSYYFIVVILKDVLHEPFYSDLAEIFCPLMIA